MRYLITTIIFCMGTMSANAWDGYDCDSSEYIEIEKRNLVRPGRDIEVYHWDLCEYIDEEVISVSSHEVETYDPETDQYHTYDMD